MPEGSTYNYVSATEMVKLLSERAEQLNYTDNRKYYPLHEKVKSKVVSGGSNVLLAAMELFDDSIEFPVLLVRNGRQLRVHRDIVLPQHIRNYMTIKIGDRFIMGDVSPDMIAECINTNLAELDIYFNQR